MLNGQEFQSLFLVFELSQPIWDCYSCYATQRLIALIDNMRKIYYCSEKLIQSIDDTCGAEKFATLSWNESERKSGKIIKIKGIILR